MANQRFTLDEANALLPTLELEFSRLMQAQEQAHAAAAKLGGAEQALAVLEQKTLPPGGEEAARELIVAHAELVMAIERVNALGCLVKNVELGLVDFPGRHEGKEVHLCWQYGEPQVLHFHGVDEEDAKRRPLFEGAGELLHVH